MVGKNFNWHKRWQVNVLAGTASHESGLTVIFTRGLDAEKGEVGCFSYVENRSTGEEFEYTGRVLGGDEGLIAFLRAHPNLKHPNAINSRLARLMKEAGKAWAFAKKREIEYDEHDEN